MAIFQMYDAALKLELPYNILSYAFFQAFFFMFISTNKKLKPNFFLAPIL